MFLDPQEKRPPVFPGERDGGKRDVRDRMKVCKSAVTQRRTRGLGGQKEETEAWGKEAEIFQLKENSKTDPPPSKANAVLRQSPHIKALLPVTDMFNQPPPGGTHHHSLLSCPWRGRCLSSGLLRVNVKTLISQQQVVGINSIYDRVGEGEEEGGGLWGLSEHPG